MTHPPLNQPTLFCLECFAPADEFIDETGKCEVCGNNNIYQRFTVPVNLSMDAFSFEEALAKVAGLFDALGVTVTFNIGD